MPHMGPDETSASFPLRSFRLAPARRSSSPLTFGFAKAVTSRSPCPASYGRRAPGRFMSVDGVAFKPLIFFLVLLVTAILDFFPFEQNDAGVCRAGPSAVG